MCYSRRRPTLAVAGSERVVAFSDHAVRQICDHTEALRLNPKDAHAYFYRGLASLKKGDHVHAAADREKALQLDPSLDER